ncbi:DUF2235 domain-containing protein [Yoonia sp.]|uniref:DUF2235 domain-containing protein n=1 Tax=Yoonia sp. TaxID=2212373 RepID=UPI002FDB002C
MVDKCFLFVPIGAIPEPEELKKIVILCDGTWNRVDSTTPTNVVRLGQLLRPTNATGVHQIPIYVQGVGTAQGVGRVSSFAERWLGGMFGLGLYRNLIDAYIKLTFMYEPGDEIFIFGFSRGAFTARSLTGFIRATGIIPRDSLHLLPRAIARYQDKTRGKKTHPSSDESHAFRLETSPFIATSEKEVSWRETQGKAAPTLLRISYLGVWDSVGALGVPRYLSVAPLLNGKKYDFHDASLSSMVKAARHAVALDERRRSFEPTRWDNVRDLNAEQGDDSLPYQELYFVGDHGSVGGGGDIVDLSSIALGWIAEGAQQAGLALQEKDLAAIRKAENFRGPIHNSLSAPGLVTKLMRNFGMDRKGPDTVDELHPSVFARWKADKAYRPGSLAHLKTQLDVLSQR